MKKDMIMIEELKRNCKVGTEGKKRIRVVVHAGTEGIDEDAVQSGIIEDTNGSAHVFLEKGKAVLRVVCKDVSAIKDAKVLVSAILSGAKSVGSKSLCIDVSCISDHISIYNIVLEIEKQTYSYCGKSNSSEDESYFIEFIHSDQDIDDVVNEASSVGYAVNYAKRLGDLPSNICTPSYLAETARGIESSNTSVEILGEEDIIAKGMGGVHAVSKGSAKKPHVIKMEYDCGIEGADTICLVGKAVTFDSGGISIKPSASMEEMKYDMCGGATVMAIMDYLANRATHISVNVVGLVGAVENMPSGSAVNPGDVITIMDGTTVEVVNTDAEGRLVLADLLVMAAEYNPTDVIDFATLTGACCVALGDVFTGLFTESDSLANDIIDAGENTGDKAWRLPVTEEYDALIKSNFADIKNVGGRYAGATTAACFLKHFASKYDYRWAHMDIAGSSFSKKATGRPVESMIDLLGWIETQ